VDPRHSAEGADAGETPVRPQETRAAVQRTIAASLAGIDQGYTALARCGVDSDPRARASPGKNYSPPLACPLSSENSDVTARAQLEGGADWAQRVSVRRNMAAHVRRRGQFEGETHRSPSWPFRQRRSKFDLDGPEDDSVRNEPPIVSFLAWKMICLCALRRAGVRRRGIRWGD
jgi:hypothetical protein